MVAVVLLLAACGQASPEWAKNQGRRRTPAISRSTGDASADVNKLAVEAIADLQDYWGKEFPHLYGKDYAPVKGGFFAVIPSRVIWPCASDASDDLGQRGFYRRPDASTYHISPGDLGEEDQGACLFPRREGDVERTGG